MTVTQTVVREYEADLLVCGAEPVAADVVALTLARPDGEALPGWTPGAHIDLVLPDGLVRQYSLCGHTEEPGRWRVAVLRAPDSRGGSTAVHALTHGSTVKVRGPRNHFPVVPANRSVFQAVRDAGVSVLGSCLEGICGTCETEVLDGDIDHRDSVLDPGERAAGDCMMICVSRARSARLTLDL
jgi:ferredoxin